jgi:hypothetical protein
MFEIVPLKASNSAAEIEFFCQLGLIFEFFSRHCDHRGKCNVVETGEALNAAAGVLSAVNSTALSKVIGQCFSRREVFVVPSEQPPTS